MARVGDEFACGIERWLVGVFMEARAWALRIDAGIEGAAQEVRRSRAATSLMVVRAGLLSFSSFLHSLNFFFLSVLCCSQRERVIDGSTGWHLGGVHRWN
jgi:hypothetical protein